MIPKGEVTPHLLKLAHYINLVLTIGFIILALVFGDYDVSSESSGKSAFAIVFPVAFITLFTGHLKDCITRHDSIYKTSMLKRCSRDIKIGCSGMFVFAIIPCVVAIFSYNSGIVMFTTISSCNISSIAIYYMFLSSTDNLCRLLTSLKHIFIVVVVDSILLLLVFVVFWLTHSPHLMGVLAVFIPYTFLLIPIVISFWSIMTDRIVTRVKITHEYTVFGRKLKSIKKGCMNKTVKDRRMLALNEINLSKIDKNSTLNEIEKRLTGLESKQDFNQARQMLNARIAEIIKADREGTPLQVLSVYRRSTGMEETNVDEDNTQDSENRDIETNVVHESSLESTSLICEVCMVEYDNLIKIQTPRILTKCGHTMCQGCIEYILSRQKEPKIMCPFCRKVTAIIGGNVQSLPRNLKL